ncbi:hypothetical protein IFM89_022239 [Coptis chinensis]|uniref:DUF1771 domain-containing protein n=1 Tax=Coptis chinensis TaxID=261450 RepID=A0A835H205_9MAGN|nr:hypothetical protein IFM89_022239 [Coptis chinensis]
MEVHKLGSLEHDDETRALAGLLDIFASAFSLREIASAFCKAGRNAEIAAGILAESNGCTSSASTSQTSNERSTEAVPSENSTNADGNSKSLKHKKQSASVGTVSSVLGKAYSKPTTASNGLYQTSKPLKINLTEFQMNEVEGDDILLDSSTSQQPIDKDVEFFLFKMLGEGFQLSMDVIRDVLGSCGYDTNKSIEKLVDQSASTLNKSDDIIGGFAEKFAEEDSNQQYSSPKKASKSTGLPLRNEAEQIAQERRNLSREVLTSLFSAPDRPEEQPRKTLLSRAVKNKRSYGTVVSEPLEDRIHRTPSLLPYSIEPQKDTDDDVEEEDSYQVLRRTAREHWVTMKEYYKAAVEAFSKGNHTLAEKLLQQGQFYNNKAREADAKSSQKVFECSNKESPDDVVLDVHDHDVKQAIRLMKVHLSSLSGIQSIQKLKVIVETGEDITQGSRKRRVLKFLERESIKWTEEGGTITIPLAEIDPDLLSFAPKSDD